MKARKLVPLALGAVLLTGAATFAATGAAFTDSEQVTADVSAGTLNLQVDNKDSSTAHVITVAPNTVMKPGDVRTATFKVQNTGTLAAPFTVARAATGDTGLAAVMDVTVTRNGTNVMATSKLNATTPTIAGSTLAVAGEDTYVVTFTLPATATNAVMGKTAGLSLTFNTQL